MQPLMFQLATDRQDKGKTANYYVFAGGGTIETKNGKGEVVQKNAVLGSNGTIYIAHQVAEGVDGLVILDRREYDRLMAAAQPKASAKKGKK